jgi:hypothetical protein
MVHDCDFLTAVCDAKLATKKSGKNTIWRTERTKSVGQYSEFGRQLVNELPSADNPLQGAQIPNRRLLLKILAKQIFLGCYPPSGAGIRLLKHSSRLGKRSTIQT